MVFRLSLETGKVEMERREIKKKKKTRRKRRRRRRRRRRKKERKDVVESRTAMRAKKIR